MKASITSITQIFEAMKNQLSPREAFGRLFQAVITANTAEITTVVQGFSLPAPSAEVCHSFAAASHLPLSLHLNRGRCGVVQTPSLSKMARVILAKEGGSIIGCASYGFGVTVYPLVYSEMAEGQTLAAMAKSAAKAFCPV